MMTTSYLQNVNARRVRKLPG